MNQRVKNWWIPNNRQCNNLDLSKFCSYVLLLFDSQDDHTSTVILRDASVLRLFTRAGDDFTVLDMKCFMNPLGGRDMLSGSSHVSLAAALRPPIFIYKHAKHASGFLSQHGNDSTRDIPGSCPDPAARTWQVCLNDVSSIDIKRIRTDTG